jgi:outer membrane beta-barrel protein
MNTASRLLAVLGLSLAIAGGAFGASRAEAQEVQVTGPLAGAPAVRHMRIYRDGRFQIQPSFGLTINDEFAQSTFAGVQLAYHFTDWLGLSAFFHYDVYSNDTGITDQVVKRGVVTDRNRLSLPTAGGFSDQIGRITYLSGVQATFIPLRGKLSLFQALFVDTDFYLFGGVAFAGIEERADVAEGTCSGPIYEMNPANESICRASQNARASRMAIAPTFGVGLSLYFTDYLAMTLEYRAFPFKWNTSGTDEGGRNEKRQLDESGEFPDGKIDASDRSFQFNQMFTLGFAFYLPVHGEITE